ncbi:tRNA (adenosine(37)-N6)-threonylcarbamoyltransferase complex dimerization subunit type 1 TsaB [Halioglobus japonicus]|uniref:tRNA threonylcarbamoyladenosine biosynthesis protein TsaB n=1 Tax=Halioglobus japonicus TaxID=930805 RepID=A0AAP8MER9_9GAMM|nr:tRNA (adenosine(37)-N6)-threonylcarbamoyltransferase complex dimerization subunit type 1 TsaB [Halioglobus japonicus]AQA18484.1 tRNA (adenosine(37)-N6)-threonylcarbamoyltransferase complex dimerization subunit type 1 TsaB [Halioglobus japonicus]PLW86501.1 tRNA (adenosine(37)-N6)-threonylcarbamoyltransferase complex dimerization subunit type 1 TsaB [Halioglobus japonicus]GHD12524.1 tRNA (adenosine(37)-N6)-threonylcarbamoyltransferase complex dimerization subunit type 1 TsaB [Halioglobus japoni
MNGILAIETATEACSVALWRDGNTEHRHELAARQHNQRLFSMLRELLPDGVKDIDAIAYGSGPGSFTGLRIAASAVQGLAFSAGVPAVPVSTLACQVQTALREGLVEEGGYVLSCLDARIKEVYFALYRIEGDEVFEVQAAAGVKPEQMTIAELPAQMVAIGDGCAFVDQFPESVQKVLTAVHAQVLPEARDLIPAARRMLASGTFQKAADVHPVYVRDEVNWKKIHEQGKPS